MIPAAPGPITPIQPPPPHSLFLPQVALRNETSKTDRFATSGGWAHLVSDASRTLTFLSSTQWGNQDSLQSHTNGFQLKFLSEGDQNKLGINVTCAKP